MGSLAGSEIVGMSAVELAEAIRAQVVDPVQVVAAHVERIRAFDPVVRAFVEVFEQEALAEAAALVQRGDLDALPLAGVPVAVKENVAVRGHRVRSGSAATASSVSAEDHPVVRLLRSAGAVVLGHTRLSELALWPQTEGVWGATVDPWDLARNAGGSSGGSAAAVAAGMVPLAIGNDAMGSIRVPAASCGVVGVKPGQGVLPAEIGVNSWYGTAVNGPIATTVDDARLALVVLSGGAVGSAHPGIEQVRIGVVDSSPFPGTRVAEEACSGMRTVAELLTRAGLTVRPVGSVSLQRFALPMLARWFATAHAEGERLDRSPAATPDPQVSVSRCVGAAPGVGAGQGRCSPAQRPCWCVRRPRRPADPGDRVAPTRAAGLARPVVDHQRPVLPPLGRSLRQHLEHGRIPRPGRARRDLAGRVAPRGPTRRRTRRRGRAAGRGQPDREAPTVAPARATAAARDLTRREGKHGHLQVRRRR